MIYIFNVLRGQTLNTTNLKKVYLKAQNFFILKGNQCIGKRGGQREEIDRQGNKPSSA